MSHAACRVEFQPFKRSYSQLTFFNFLQNTLCAYCCTYVDDCVYYPHIQTIFIVDQSVWYVVNTHNFFNKYKIPCVHTAVHMSARFQSQRGDLPRTDRNLQREERGKKRRRRKRKEGEGALQLLQQN